MVERSSDDSDAAASMTLAPRSALAPRARKGFVSSDDGVPTEAYVSFIAAALRASIGALFVFMATLWLPVHMMTPILTGMGILMIANGLLATWRQARETPRLKAASRVFLYGVPFLVIVDFVLLGILGPSSIGPDWSALRHERAVEQAHP
jgi:hypothetical protein